MSLQDIKDAIGLKPFYSNSNGVLYNADCLEIMAKMPDKCVDLVLTDPPYGIGVAKNGKVGGEKCCTVTDYGKQDWDYKPMSSEQQKECQRISLNQIFFGGNYFQLPPSSCWLVWDKDNTGNFADCELAWTSFDTAVRKFKWRWNGMLQEDMLNKEERKHPTQKPLPLMEWCLRKYATGGGVIADMFLGSGTTAVACEKLGRKWIGVEISEKYCEIAAKRIQAENNQLKLFT